MYAHKYFYFEHPYLPEIWKMKNEKMSSIEKSAITFAQGCIICGLWGKQLFEINCESSTEKHLQYEVSVDGVVLLKCFKIIHQQVNRGVYSGETFHEFRFNFQYSFS